VPADRRQARHQGVIASRSRASSPVVPHRLHSKGRGKADG
jgi:hypothetical protein